MRERLIIQGVVPPSTRPMRIIVPRSRISACAAVKCTWLLSCEEKLPRDGGTVQSPNMARDMLPSPPGEQPGPEPREPRPVPPDGLRGRVEPPPGPHPARPRRTPPRSRPRRPRERSERRAPPTDRRPSGQKPPHPDRTTTAVGPPPREPPRR